VLGGAIAGGTLLSLINSRSSPEYQAEMQRRFAASGGKPTTSSPEPEGLPDRFPHARQFALDMIRAERAGGNQAGNTTSTEVNVNQMTVTTQAKDAPGIASDIHKAFQHYSHATNANNGIR
jgi:hypothetical protein